jgi:serine protease
MLASVGLLPFAPLVQLASRAGSLRWVVEILMRPVGEWDIVWSAGVHRYLLLASALPSFAFLALLFGAKKMRGTLGGFAVGAAALLTQIFVSADVASPLSTLGLRVFCVVNALACLWIARISLDEKARS